MLLHLCLVFAVTASHQDTAVQGFTLPDQGNQCSHISQHILQAELDRDHSTNAMTKLLLQLPPPCTFAMKWSKWDQIGRTLCHHGSVQRLQQQAIKAATLAESTCGEITVLPAEHLAICVLSTIATDIRRLWQVWQLPTFWLSGWRHTRYTISQQQKPCKRVHCHSCM